MSQNSYGSAMDQILGAVVLVSVRLSQNSYGTTHTHSTYAFNALASAFFCSRFIKAMSPPILSLRMESALKSGLGHLLQNRAHDDALVVLSVDENGFAHAVLADVARYELLMHHLLYLPVVEKPNVEAGLEAIVTTPVGKWHNEEAEKIMMLYRVCLRACRRKTNSDLWPIQRIKAVYLETHGSWSGRGETQESHEAHEGTQEVQEGGDSDDAGSDDGENDADCDDVAEVPVEISEAVEISDDDAAAKAQLLAFPSFRATFGDDDEMTDEDNEHISKYDSFLAPGGVPLVDVAQAAPVDHVQHKQRRVDERKLERLKRKRKPTPCSSPSTPTTKRKQVVSDISTKKSKKQKSDPSTTTTSTSRKSDPRTPKTSKSSKTVRTMNRSKTPKSSKTPFASRSKKHFAANPNNLDLKTQSVDSLVMKAKVGFVFECHADVSQVFVRERPERKKYVVLQLKDGKTNVVQCIKEGTHFGNLGQKAMQVLHKLYIDGADAPFLEGVKIALSVSLSPS